MTDAPRHTFPVSIPLIEIRTKFDIYFVRWGRNCHSYTVLSSIRYLQELLACRSVCRNASTLLFNFFRKKTCLVFFCSRKNGFILVVFMSTKHCSHYNTCTTAGSCYRYPTTIFCVITWTKRSQQHISAQAEKFLQNSEGQTVTRNDKRKNPLLLFTKIYDKDLDLKS